MKIKKEAENSERLKRERKARGEKLIQIDPKKKIFNYIKSSTEGYNICNLEQFDSWIKDAEKKFGHEWS
jgi:hypothetical protein